MAISLDLQKPATRNRVFAQLRALGYKRTKFYYGDSGWVRNRKGCVVSKDCTSIKRIIPNEKGWETTDERYDITGKTLFDFCLKLKEWS